MKTARVTVAFLLSFVAAAYAAPFIDPEVLTPAPEVAPPAQATPNDDTPDPDPVGEDPDGVPKAFRHSSRTQLTSADRAALREAEKKIADDRNWLLRDYEKQLQSRAHGENSETNIYAELSGDKDLARLSGISPTDFTSMPDSIDLHTGDHSSTSSLRPDPALNAATPKVPASTPLFKPLIKPLAFAEVSGAATPYAAPSPIITPPSTPISIESAP